MYALRAFALLPLNEAILGRLICIHPHLGGFFHEMATAFLKNTWLNLCTSKMFSLTLVCMCVVYVCMCSCVKMKAHMYHDMHTEVKVLHFHLVWNILLLFVAGYTRLDGLGASRSLAPILI